MNYRIMPNTIVDYRIQRSAWWWPMWEGLGSLHTDAEEYLIRLIIGNI